MNLLISIINDSYPLIIFFLEIFISIRIIYIIINKVKLDLFKEIMVILFIIYIVILFYIISRHEYSYKIINIKPFKEILRYNIYSKLFIKNTIGNILLFIPYSLFLSYYFKINKLYIILILCFILSLTIELIQINIGRVFDIDDIILNLISGIIGYFIYRVFRRIIIFFKIWYYEFVKKLVYN